MTCVRSNTESTIGSATSVKLQTIAAVLVTHNRLALLQECVEALRCQTRRIDEIIVVNNGSTDGTGDWLAAQPDLTVITQGNEGSSGGQFTGINTAFGHGHDWFWCMDDDTIPDADALAAMTRSAPFADESTGFLCSLTVDSRGQVDVELPTTASHEWWGTVLKNHCVRVDLATFISVLYSRRAVETVGLPLRWMFIWGEDFEYSRRVAGRLKGWAVLDSRVVHKYVSKTGVTDPYADPRTRTRLLYLIRNELVRVRTDPLLGRFNRLLAIAGCLHRSARLVLLRKMPLKTFAWVWDGLFRRVRFEFPFCPKTSNVSSPCAS